MRKVFIGAGVLYGVFLAAEVLACVFHVIGHMVWIFLMAGILKGSSMKLQIWVDSCS